MSSLRSRHRRTGAPSVMNYKYGHSLWGPVTLPYRWILKYIPKITRQELFRKYN